MSTTINWGIIGLGKIAHKFAHDLNLVSRAALKAVASHSTEKAAGFAQQYRAESHYGSYQELAEDPEVDIVYIATPHAFHFENTMLCLQNAKAVLCEKPMGLNADEVKAMIQEAQKRKLFLMEGIWTRFMPSTLKMLELIKNEKLGEIHSIRADFGFKAPFDPHERLFNKSLGGGSLMDIGIYPAFLAQLIFGKPDKVVALARRSSTDVDAQCAMLFGYQKNAMATLDSTFENDTPTEAHIFGSKGSLKMHSRFHQSERLTLSTDAGEKSYDLPYQGNGYVHEIEEVVDCLRHGKTESPKLPLKFSLELAQLLDRVKEQINLKY